MTDKLKCTRLKLSPDGMNCNAGRICERNATRMRSDGRAFCTPCAKTEKNAIFTDHLTWAAINATVSIDHRCDLGNTYWKAERSTSNAPTVSVATPCEVRTDCGAIIQPNDRAAVWYFTRNADNGTTVAWLCDRCDIDLLGQADEAVVEVR